jgi:hypothetical protein
MSIHDGAQHVGRLRALLVRHGGRREHEHKVGVSLILDQIELREQVC